MKIKLLFLLLLITSVAFAQENVVSGYVYDAKENLPLEGAIVYLDGTTIAANTDSKGFFKLKAANKINVSLIVSFIGFETFRLEDPFSYGKPVKILLREDAIALDEVVIEKNPLFTRKQLLRVFRQQFLGESSVAKSCKIENEDDIRLYYDEKARQLKAKAVKPLRITNKKLEYKVVFDLNEFAVQYNTVTINKEYLFSSFFSGSSFYTDTSVNGSADKERKNAYLGSPMHFMRTVAAKSWQKEKFQLYVDRFPDNPENYFSVTDTLNFKKVTLIDVPPSLKEIKTTGLGRKSAIDPVTKKVNMDYAKYIRFNVLYDKKVQSVFTLNYGYFYIDENGLFLPVHSLTFAGYFGEVKAGDMLPADYTVTN
jgi:hypothetical protein